MPAHRMSQQERIRLRIRVILETMDSARVVGDRGDAQQRAMLERLCTTLEQFERLWLARLQQLEQAPLPLQAGGLP
jgi:hypothetical protein